MSAPVSRTPSGKRSTSAPPKVDLTPVREFQKTAMESPRTDASFSHLKTEAAEKLPQALNNLALELYKKFAVNQRKENVIFSPLSIAFALSLVESCTGSMDNHPTRNELQRLIGPIVSNMVQYSELYGSVKDRILATTGAHDLLQFATLIVCNDGIEIHRDYQMQLYDTVKGEVLWVPLHDDPEAARIKINTWFGEKSEVWSNIVKTAIHARASSVFLLDGIFLKMKWDAKFFTAVTVMKDFFQFGGNERKTVPFIIRIGLFGLKELPNMDILEIPFVNQELNMYVIVPKRRNGIAKIENELLDTAKLLALFELTSNDPYRKIWPVHFAMPHLNIRSRLEVKPILSSMGVRHFDRLNLLTDDMRANVSEVIHDAVFEMGDVGNLASREQHEPDTEPVIIADHPFMFAVVACKPVLKIIFMGKVNCV